MNSIKRKNRTISNIRFSSITTTVTHEPHHNLTENYILHIYKDFTVRVAIKYQVLTVLIIFFLFTLYKTHKKSIKNSRIWNKQICRARFLLKGRGASTFSSKSLHVFFYFDAILTTATDPSFLSGSNIKVILKSLSVVQLVTTSSFEIVKKMKILIFATVALGQNWDTSIMEQSERIHQLKLNSK